jgi:hypothetical protein
VNIGIMHGLWIIWLTLQVFESSAEDNAWRLEEGSDRRLEKTAQWGVLRIMFGG